MKNPDLQAKWIMSGHVNDKACKLPPETYRKEFFLRSTKNAELKISALGIYTAYINGVRVGADFFTPGYTNYKRHVQLQTYDVSSFVGMGRNVIEITVANGWYLGRIGSKHNVYGDRRAVIAELSAGDEKLITDESWEVTFDGPVRFADFYDGETIDRTAREKEYESVKLFDGFTPELTPQIGTFVREQGILTPKKRGSIYDFGQNFAGTVRLRVRAEQGTVLTVRHAEILVDGKMFYDNYRTAKATLTLVCADGENVFSPQFTYTGFRYAEVTADKPIELLAVEGVVLHSDMAQIGSFSCSDERINKLQSCILWSGRSNLVDIPTDCPQRDERLGWTGDIGIYSRTANFNFDTRLFFRKYLADIRSEQAADGAIPAAIPCTGMYEPKKYPIPLMMWGDAAVMIPWNCYRSYGDKQELSESYESMKRYVLCEKSYAEKYGSGMKKYLWNKNPYQFGDWCACKKGWLTWNRRGNHLATLWYFNSVCILAKAGRELGFLEDERFFSDLAQKIQNAFVQTYLRPDGSFRHADFVSMYVCALHFGIIPEEHREKVAARLAAHVRKAEYKVMTGFPGTPYLLFALCDNGYEDLAYRVLMNEDCPGWLHMVKNGATTVWERWDAIEQDGSFFHGGAGMVSFNHYALGVVGDFLYQRVLGLSPVEAGYSVFAVKPVCGTLGEANGTLETAHGRIEVSWRRERNRFAIRVLVPKGTEAVITLPDGSSETKGAGLYEKAIAL